VLDILLLLATELTQRRVRQASAIPRGLRHEGARLDRAENTPLQVREAVLALEAVRRKREGGVHSSFRTPE